MLQFYAIKITFLTLISFFILSPSHLFASQSIFSSNPSMMHPISPNNFIKVNGLRFKDQDDKPFFINGMNFWSCMNMAAEDNEGGDLKRLQNELDFLAEHGINVIRIMAAIEGAPTHQPFRVYPVIQIEPGKWDEKMLIALDRCLVESSKRNIRVIMTMGNAWQWTGGIAQLYSWANDNIPIPYPKAWNLQCKKDLPGWGNLIDPSKNLSKDQDDFMKFQQKFFKNEKAQEIYFNYLKMIINRKNSLTGTIYSDDPTILAWEPLNEPQTADASGIKLKEGEVDPMIIWHHKVSDYIKTNAPKQLSTTGSEGKQKEHLFKQLHDHPSIDFTCVHIWAEGWGYYDMMDSSEISLEKAKKFSFDYLNKVQNWSKELKKPIILEEFGMTRDNWMNEGKEYIYDTNTTTTHRDTYFSFLFDEIIFKGYKNSLAFAGLLPWSWGGSFDTQNKKINEFGLSFAGDPPQDPPGANSIQQNDTTMTLIKSWNDRILHSET